MIASPAPDQSSDTLRVLLVEDNYLVATALEQTLFDLGCQVVGPAPSLKRGLELAEQADLHGAILDINIVGGSSAKIADVLLRRHLPFFFITGYASPQLLPESMRHVRKLTKPIDHKQLAQAVYSEFH